MATYRKHIFILVIVFAALFAGLIYYSVLEYSLLFTATIFGIGIVFTILPDIDTKSQGQYFFYLVLFIVNIFLILRKEYIYSAYLGLVLMLPILSSHRSWSHRWYTAFIFPLLIIFIGYYYFNISDYKILLPYYIAGVTGYLLHLIVDKRF